MLTNGMRSDRMLMPENTSTLAASTMPGHLGRGRHLAQVVDDADAQDEHRGDDQAERLGVVVEDGAEGVSRQATAMPTRNPTSIPTPPSGGVGRSWTRRSSGLTTAPMRTASRSTRGMTTKVVNVTTARTMA